MMLGGIVFAVILVIGIWAIAMYNGMVRGRNAVEEAWSGISVQLKRRHELIPNLVNSVKAYAGHEKDVFAAVSEARSASLAVSARDVAGTAQAENVLTGALKSLFAVAEAYPELKANENFLQLQDQLATLEDELQMARRYYNGTARDQNNRTQQFPGNLLAGACHFEKVAYFELDDASEKAAPVVAF